MLVACRLAGLSALETYYGGVRASAISPCGGGGYAVRRTWAERRARTRRLAGVSLPGALAHYPSNPAKAVFRPNAAMSNGRCGGHDERER